MAKVQIFCFLASYVVAFVLELARMLGKSRLHRAVTLGFGLAGFGAHTLYLLNRGGPPLLSSVTDWMLVLAWLLVLFYLFFTLLHKDLALGVFTLPVVILLVASTYLMRDTPPQEMLDALRGLKLLHASFLVFGMGGVAGGFVAGLMYLVQHRRLRTRHAVRDGLTMPSLEKLAQLNRWSVMVAFPLLTLGFATGVFLLLRVNTSERQVTFADPTVIVSGVLWLLLAVVFLFVLTVRTTTGKQVAWLTLCGCGFLLLAVVGLQIISGSHFPKVPSTESRAAIKTITVGRDV